MTNKTTSKAKDATQKTNAAPAAAPDAAQANASNVTPLVTKSKIDIARDHFHRINAEGYQAAANSTPRKDFIAVCIKELEMTENGASTYWQNLRNEDKGEGLYKGSRQPTGAPVGRRPDVQGRVKKAAAKVQKLRDRVQEDMKALGEAESELITLSTQAAGVTAG